MIRTIIFDLSEVLIAGLIGIEKPLARRLAVPPDVVLAAFGGDALHELLCGDISEDAYLAQIIERQGWHISRGALKRVIRRNFHRRVPGMDGILARLRPGYELVLLSDHAAEWAAYIESIHPFLQDFSARFYSYQLKQTKREPSTFRMVLSAIGRAPAECLFVDDSPVNVQAAASAGLPALRYETARQLAARLAEYDIHG